MNLNAPSFTTYEECRAHINRLNAQRSTGPKTAEGKARSSQNSLKHGIYSQQLLREGGDPAEHDRLRTALHSEHQPATATEEILVNELVHHFWRLRRYREMEARAWQPDAATTAIDNGLLGLLARTVAAAERGFFRALMALTKLQKARGFVPQKAPAAVPAPSLPTEVIEEVMAAETLPTAACNLPRQEKHPFGNLHAPRPMQKTSAKGHKQVSSGKFPTP